MDWFLYDRNLRHERINQTDDFICTVILTGQASFDDVAG